MLRRIELRERSDVLSGKSFGRAGPYERIEGTAYFTVDPDLAPNRIITDIALAPRNAQRQVEFSADLCVLKPRDPARGNGTLLFDVVNRGVKLAVWMLNRGNFSLDPRTAAELGDGFLLEQGFTVVWLGWQADVPRAPGRLRTDAPIATDGGRKIRGPVRSEFTADRKVLSFSLGDQDQIPYKVADANDAAMQLTVRDTGDGPRRAIPRGEWQLAREEKGAPVPDQGSVFLQAGLEPGKIYELVYTAEDPVVAGLGLAGVRDVVSFLKFGGPGDGVTLLGDQHNHLKRAICYGASQSGRFVRSFLYHGFNQDEQNRQVFDGMWAHIAGAGVGSFNHRFAQPSRGADPHVNFFYPTFLAPFTDGEQPVPGTGAQDGLLARVKKAGVAPKIFYSNTSYEYWAFAASLIHTTLDGSRDAAPGADTRIYQFAGSQHVPGPFPPAALGTRYAVNPNDFQWSLRALLLAMNRWIAEGTLPPASRYPRIADGNLVRRQALRFPRRAVAEVPGYVYQAHQMNFGPEFRSRGVVTMEPPQVGAAYPSLLPQVDQDGNEITGIRSPHIEAPLGTYTGWNFRDAASGAPEILAANLGSFFPIAKTRQERLDRRDPRPAIEERYRDRTEYLSKVRTAAEGLTAAGFLRSEDVAGVIAQAGAWWDALTK